MGTSARMGAHLRYMNENSRQIQSHARIRILHKWYPELDHQTCRSTLRCHHPEITSVHARQCHLSWQQKAPVPQDTLTRFLRSSRFSTLRKRQLMTLRYPGEI